ncbi:M24 family metallopeptidase [Heyndrickxia sp. MSNUG]|uniref:M24 family metallopeptidase n=1 Tax=Heyndrickxia sp. MSNUG TaxID=3136677 RepID=UPI003C2CD583
MSTRLKKLRNWMENKNIESLFIQSYENRRYFSQFTGSNGYLLITSDSAEIITDQRYQHQAKEQSMDFEVICHGLNPFETIQKVIDNHSIKTIGFESNEMTVNHFKNLVNMFPDTVWIPLTEEFLSMRKIKEKKEIDFIRESISLSDQAFKSLLPLIKPGMTEKEVLIELDYLMAKYGNEGPAFGTIVASDIRAAFPHAVPTENTVKNNHFLLIDFGMKVNGYMSDMTRTIWVGEPPSDLIYYYNLVSLALEKSISAIRPGVTAGEIDQVARDVFIEEGLEEFSLRGLGHGVGLQIHEKPRVVMDSNEVIEQDMLFTIEPGLYLPGKVGVRIEDIVLVNENGCEVLTKTKRHIQI